MIKGVCFICDSMLTDGDALTQWRTQLVHASCHPSASVQACPTCHIVFPATGVCDCVAIAALPKAAPLRDGTPSPALSVLKGVTRVTKGRRPAYADRTPTLVTQVRPPTGTLTPPPVAGASESEAVDISENEAVGTIESIAECGSVPVLESTRERTSECASENTSECSPEPKYSDIDAASTLTDILIQEGFAPRLECAPVYAPARTSASHSGATSANINPLLTPGAVAPFVRAPDPDPADFLLHIPPSYRVMVYIDPAYGDLEQIASLLYQVTDYAQGYQCVFVSAGAENVVAKKMARLLGWHTTWLGSSVISPKHFALCLAFVTDRGLSGAAWVNAAVATGIPTHLLPERSPHA